MRSVDGLTTSLDGGLGSFPRRLLERVRARNQFLFAEPAAGEEDSKTASYDILISINCPPVQFP